ncbi:unnamed protein product [Ambrosiozyma monospora]|uniref:Unnamed protein product n=1 Tax=Ambrosiozyma monospora TaxID=43982 RepID=A0ACB5TDM0_AMBMO|nr:unnamed protein product [Ambrosiozyma monospora]
MDLQESNTTVATLNSNNAINCEYDRAKNYMMKPGSFRNFDSRKEPTSGSFVEFVTDADSEIGFGLVLNNQHYYLSGQNKFEVLKTDGSTVLVDPEDITFTQARFINYELFEFDEGKREDLIEMVNKEVSKTMELLRYLVNEGIILNVFHSIAQNYKEATCTIPDLIYRANKCEPKFFDYIHKKNYSHCLPFALHIIMMNDPLHFRFYKTENDPMSALDPQSQVTSNYFVNPYSMTTILEHIHSLSNIDLVGYRDILNHEVEDKFYLHRLIHEDALLRTLIKHIRYTIYYPHPILISKLQSILDFKVTPKSLYDLLVRLGAYTTSDNPILSTELYGLTQNDNLGVSSLDELTFPQMPRRSVSIESDNRFGF